MKLLQYGRAVPTVFDLLGTKENDMTAALAYVLAQSSVFLRSFVSNITQHACDSIDQGIIRIQTCRRKEGITDVEIELGQSFYIIIEAKVGAIIPDRAQLGLYVPIVKRHPAAHGLIATVSNATEEFAKIKLDPPVIDGVPIVHRSWRSLKTLAEAARVGESNANKILLDQFVAYLGGLLGMEMMNSNMVYVVSLAQGNPPGWTLSWIDVVEKRRRYFYPITTGGWPDPPNYIGVRYGGRLQAIHHVDSVSIFENPHTVFPEAVDDNWGPHYCLTLGPPIVPAHPVLNGPRILRANRCACMIDTLLTAPTISDALTETERRQTNG